MSGPEMTEPAPAGQRGTGSGGDEPGSRRQRTFVMRGATRLILAAAMLLGLAAPPPARAGTPGGIGGTGVSQETGGIGGTGVSQETGGIGGTGVTNETGGIGGTGAPIVGFGPIQRFGSVFVNGREYRVDARTLVTIDGHPAPLAALRIGDMALVQGVATGAHRGIARTIASWQAIIGPVSSIARDRRSFTVLGQTVRAAAGPASLGTLRPGDVVGVSAQRQADGNWVADRVTILPTTRSFRLETTVSTLARDRVGFGGLTLDAPPQMLSGLHAGERVVATGTIRNGVPHLATLVPRPLALGAPGTRIEAQNYFRAAGDGRLVAADGMEATGAPRGRPLSGLVPVEIEGRIAAGGRIAITTLTIDLPDRPDTLPVRAAPAASGAKARSDGTVGKPRTVLPGHGVEPPELGERSETEPAEIEPPEIETPDTDFEAPEIEAPTD